jgi:hypothetical protein
MSKTPNDAAQDAAELQQLLGQPTLITIAGENLELKPITFGQLPAVLELVGPLLADLNRDGVDMVDLIMRHADRLLPLAALLTGRQREWIDALPLDEAAELIGTLIEINADFFARRVLPRLNARMDRLGGMSRSSETAAPSSTTAASGPASSVN